MLGLAISVDQVWFWVKSEHQCCFRRRPTNLSGVATWPTAGGGMHTSAYPKKAWRSHVSLAVDVDTHKLVFVDIRVRMFHWSSHIPLVGFWCKQCFSVMNVGIIINYVSYMFYCYSLAFMYLDLYLCVSLPHLVFTNYIYCIIWEETFMGKLSDYIVLELNKSPS